MIFPSERYEDKMRTVIRVSLFYRGKPFMIPIPRTWSNNGTAKENVREVEGFIRAVKVDLLNEGILTYNDCYFLARKYLFDYPIISGILRKRCRYIYIDEMQDLGVEDITLIETIFFGNSPNNIIQRIG